MRPYVDNELCVTCGACEEVCPAMPNVFTLEDKAVVVNPDACTACKTCEEDCPTQAIVVKD